MTITVSGLDPYIAYCAGLYEGEGTVCYWTNKQKKNNKTYQYGKISLQISMTDLAPIEKFQEFMNCGLINGPYDRGLNKKIYQYNISKFRDIERVILLIYPWLSPRRLKQYEEVKAKYLASRLK